MKLFQPGFIVLLTVCFFGNNLSAQKTLAGIDFGIGKTGTENYNPHINPFNKDNIYLEDYFKLGLSFLYTPKKVLSIKTGLYYDSRGDVNTRYSNWENISYLRIPAGLEFSIGRAFQFVFGIGLYTGYLISYSGSEDPNKLNFGLQRNLGFAIQLSPDFIIHVSYQRDLDLTPFVEQSATSPGGANYTDVYRGYDGFYSFSILLNFKKQ